jgi:hypothetical protein
METQAIQLSLFPDLVPVAPVKKGKKQTAAGTQLSLFSTEQWADIVAPTPQSELTDWDLLDGFVAPVPVIEPMPDDFSESSDDGFEHSYVMHFSPKVSGLTISFGYPGCEQALIEGRKTVTRRVWKDSHAKKFLKAKEEGAFVTAIDKLSYSKARPSKKIGFLKLTHIYEERIGDMPVSDIALEGGLGCESVSDFVEKFFDGNSDLIVWVVRFEFFPN